MKIMIQLNEVDLKALEEVADAITPTYDGSATITITIDDVEFEGSLET